MPRILIIDDDPSIRVGAELVLAALGFTAESAEDGAEGLARMRQSMPDVVICDINMPGMDGYDVLAAAQQDPGLARIPFILLTARTDRASQRRGMAGGADDFLTKPFQPGDLLEAIQARLRKAAARGPDPAALEAALARVRNSLGGREAEVLRLLGQDPGEAGHARSTASPWVERWIRRISALFDENDPGSILHIEDQVRSRKLIIHGAFLLSSLLLRRGDPERAAAEFAIADNLLKTNAERFRAAFAAAARPGAPATQRSLRARLLRLERKLEALRQVLAGPAC